MNYKMISGLAESLIELIAPDKCRCCGSPTNGRNDGICGSCLTKITYISDPVCRQCGLPLPNAAGTGCLCGNCIKKPPAWDEAFALVIYDTPVTELLHRLKYSADTSILPALKTVVAPCARVFDISCDFVVPVPLHKKRIRRRGLNQAVKLAELLFSEKQECITPGLLKRIRETDPQTGLNGVQRRKNLRGAFMFCDRYEVRGKSICLVDDVYTTGTTLNECSKVLRRAGAANIYVLTVARVALGR